MQPPSTAAAAAAAARHRSRNNAVVAAALGVFTAGCLAFPFLLTSRTLKEKPIIDSSRALGPQAVQRGPYLNAGSRDVGPDPTPIEAYKSKRLMQQQKEQEANAAAERSRS